METNKPKRVQRLDPVAIFDQFVLILILTTFLFAALKINGVFDSQVEEASSTFREPVQVELVENDN